ncbi:LysR substrate-binding domain-containing protein [Rhizobium sp. BR 362]|uniref:LysR substrate-binding domain-containing protein n=1 Tax=Rhizobium sp. BR 362 TaxID=3040670 RepID=UPI002F3ECBE9
MNIRRKLPPLAALTAFEAAARVRSFTKAAAELGVTQAAVSRQIHLMEETLGFPLFRRLHRSIELTDKGQVLSTAATSAFNLMADTIAELTREEDEGALSISATLAISHFWLMPKIASFSRLYPDSRLRIVSQDSAAGLGGSDLAIRYGNGAWPDGRAEYLFDDELFPVCSPEYAAKLGSAPALEDIARQPLISYDSQNPSWIGWEEWLAAFSIKLAKAPSGLRTSFYTEAVYAALSGQGIALGWKRLVQNLLDTRSLIRLTEQSIVTRDGYFLIVPPRSANSARALQFIEWLKAEAADRG